MIPQNLKTLFIGLDGRILKRIDDFLYTPITKTVIINGEMWRIFQTMDSFDEHGTNGLVRRIGLKK